MSKPIDPEELSLHVKALLRRSNLVSNHKIIIDDVVIDYDSYTVKKGDEVIELPQKEFLLLYKLLIAYCQLFCLKIHFLCRITVFNCIEYHFIFIHYFVLIPIPNLLDIF